MTPRQHFALSLSLSLDGLWYAHAFSTLDNIVIGRPNCVMYQRQQEGVCGGVGGFANTTNTCAEVAPLLLYWCSNNAEQSRTNTRKGKHTKETLFPPSQFIVSHTQQRELNLLPPPWSSPIESIHYNMAVGVGCAFIWMDILCVFLSSQTTTRHAGSGKLVGSIANSLEPLPVGPLLRRCPHPSSALPCWEILLCILVHCWLVLQLYTSSWFDIISTDKSSTS